MKGPRRILLFFSCVIETIFFGGIIAGFSSLEYILLIRGIYGQSCPSEQNITGTDTPSNFRNLTDDTTCTSQAERLSLSFTIALFVGTVSLILSGPFLDCCGVRVLKLANSAIFLGGVLCLAFAKPGTDWLIFPALSLISISGVQALSCNLKIARFYPGFETIVSTFVSGAFDSSAFSFQILKLAVQGGTPYLTYLLIYGIVGFCLYVFNAFLYQEESTEEEDLSQPILRQEEDVKSEEAIIPSFKETVFSIKFIVYVFQFLVLYLVFYYLVSFNNTFITIHFHGDLQTVKYYSSVFSYMLMGGILVSPLPAATFYIQGRIAPRLKSAELLHKSVILPFCIAIVLGILSYLVLIFSRTINDLFIMYPIFVVFRSFTFASGYAYISVAFPKAYFGKLLGVAFTLIALACLLVYPMDIWLHQSLGPLYMMIVIMLLTFANPIYIFLRT